MYAIIRLADGKMCEGIVLAVGVDRLRVALRDCHDTVEFRKAGGQWVFEDGSAVELEYVIYRAGLHSLSPRITPVRAA